QQPLAVVVIGGLFTSTILTLILLPALYAWVEEALERRVMANLNNQSRQAPLNKKEAAEEAA
ncbi:MAG: efflux RND transporter permease subunit, partial [Methylococcales bacterium]|nr:efflux RND transporter permease subunit [Methylococcales bacterium]